MPLDVVRVRGTLDEPLEEEGLSMYKAGSKVLIVRRLIEIVGDGHLFGDVYLARTTFADRSLN
jgi:hypothetical protein